MPSYYSPTPPPKKSSYTTSYNRPAAPKPPPPPPPPPRRTPPPPPPPRASYPFSAPPPPPKKSTGADTRFNNMKPAVAPPPPPPRQTVVPSQYRYVPSYASPANAAKVTQQNLQKAVADLGSGDRSKVDAALKVLSPGRTTPPKVTTKTKTKKKQPTTVTDSPAIIEEPEIVFDPPVYSTPPSSRQPGTSEPTTETTPPIKTASIDTVLFNDELVSAEIIADLLFENIGGQEILTIARHDTVNGQDVTYQPIKNLSVIQQQFGPENLVKIQGTSVDTFNNFPINLQSKIPNVGNGTSGSNVYTDSDGNIIIEFINLEEGQEIEVQITSSGTIESIGE